VLEQSKVVYVATPKAACSSLKWVIAEVGGEDLSAFRQVESASSSASIHARRLWQRVPRLRDLSDAELAEIDSDHGWHIFAVVRHPATRLWSSWQQKVLLCAPHRRQKVPEHHIPDPPETSEDLARAFGAFVSGLASGEFEELSSDLHFQSQHHILAADRMPYTRVYTTSELDSAMEDLDRQVSRQGGNALPPLPSINETPLKPVRSIFPPDTLSLIRETYADDFDAWFPEAAPPGVAEAEYPSELLADVGRLMAENRRARERSGNSFPAV
jgi:hypothetical protein